MRGIIATLATVWRIAAPYFRSDDKWAGRILSYTTALVTSLTNLTRLVQG